MLHTCDEMIQLQNIHLYIMLELDLPSLVQSLTIIDTKLICIEDEYLAKNRNCCSHW